MTTYIITNTEMIPPGMTAFELLVNMITELSNKVDQSHKELKEDTTEMLNTISKSYDRSHKELKETISTSFRELSTSISENLTNMKEDLIHTISTYDITKPNCNKNNSDNANDNNIEDTQSDVLEHNPNPNIMNIELTNINTKPQSNDEYQDANNTTLHEHESPIVNMKTPTMMTNEATKYKTYNPYIDNSHSHQRLTLRLRKKTTFSYNCRSQLRRGQTHNSCQRRDIKLIAQHKVYDRGKSKLLRRS